MIKMSDYRLIITCKTCKQSKKVPYITPGYSPSQMLNCSHNNCTVKRFDLGKDEVERILTNNDLPVCPTCGLNFTWERYWSHRIKCAKMSKKQKYFIERTVQTNMTQF